MLEKERDKSDILFQDSKISEHSFLQEFTHRARNRILRSALPFSLSREGRLQKLKIQTELRGFSKVHPQSPSDDFTFDALDYFDQRGNHKKKRLSLARQKTKINNNSLPRVFSNSGFTKCVFDVCEKPCTPTEMLSRSGWQNGAFGF